MKHLTAIALGFLLVSCNDSGFRGAAPRGTANTEKAKEKEKEPPRPEPTPAPAPSSNLVKDTTKIKGNVDIVIALDSSGSMDDEMQGVISNLGQMMTTLLQSSLDPHIHLILQAEDEDDELTITLPSSVDASKVAIVREVVDSHNAIGQVSRLLSGQFSGSYTDIKGKSIAAVPFRSDAKLEVLVVSDDNGENDDDNDDGFGNTAADFDDKWNATFSGIVGLEDSAEAEGNCNVENVGEEYLILAEKSAGTVLDICSSDYSALTQRFSTDIVKRSLVVALSKIPADNPNFAVTLGGKALTKDEWSYDSATRSIVVSSTVQAEAGAEIVVQYEAVP